MLLELLPILLERLLPMLMPLELLLPELTERVGTDERLLPMLHERLLRPAEVACLMPELLRLLVPPHEPLLPRFP